MNVQSQLTVQTLNQTWHFPAATHSRACSSQRPTLQVGPKSGSFCPPSPCGLEGSQGQGRRLLCPLWEGLAGGYSCLFLSWVLGWWSASVWPSRLLQGPQAGPSQRVSWSPAQRSPSAAFLPVWEANRQDKNDLRQLSPVPRKHMGKSHCSFLSLSQPDPRHFCPLSLRPGSPAFRKCTLKRCKGPTRFGGEVVLPPSPKGGWRPSPASPGKRLHPSPTSHV